jgi:hypothetical protein
MTDTPNLETLTEELVELMMYRLKRTSNTHFSPNERHESWFRVSSKKFLSEKIDKDGVDGAVDYITKVRILYLFG